MSKHLSTHCSTCGKKFIAPRTWRYCSKRCQFGRLGWRRRRRIKEHPTRLEEAHDRLRIILDRMRVVALALRGTRARDARRQAVAERWDTLEYLELSRQMETAGREEREQIKIRMSQIEPASDQVQPLLSRVSADLSALASTSPNQVGPALERLIAIATKRLEMLTRAPSEEAQP